MAQNSTIEWTDATWNPVTGCTKISPGCDHCYAERFSERFRGVSLRNDVKYQATVLRTGQPGLFGSAISDGAVASYEDERKMQLEQAYAKLLELLRSHAEGILFGEMIGPILETPLTWKSDLNAWINDLRKQGKVEVLGMNPRERTYKLEHRIVLREAV